MEAIKFLGNMPNPISFCALAICSPDGHLLTPTRVGTQVPRYLGDTGGSDAVGSRWIALGKQTTQFQRHLVVCKYPTRTLNVN